MTDINWTGEYDDYTARVDGYILRAEDMGAGLWWWCCYFPEGKQRDVYTDKWAETEEQAKTFAEDAMNEHRKKQ